MKKQWFIYIALLSLMFLGVSCMNDDDKNTVDLSPYASLNSFSVADMLMYTDAVTAEGKDTVVKQVVVGINYPFIIDQKNLEVYNPDSLPLGTDVTGVNVSVQSDGVVFIYVDSLETFVYLSSTDSLNFTKPRRMLVQSLDGEHSKEYKVRLNVHKADPEAMSWTNVVAPNIVEPMRALAFGGKMLVLGKNPDGALLVAESPMDIVEWSEPIEITTLPLSAQLSSVQQFNDVLYAVADGVLYSSTDGSNWSAVVADGAFETLLTASSESLWAVVDGSLAYTNDGTSFAKTIALPEQFPTENVSSAVYPLVTNPFISRYLLIGYAKDRTPAYPVVWSRLSTEDNWIQYPADEEEAYRCPAFENMTVVRYDNSLYAFGGKATIGETAISSFESFYASKDNGLTWMPLNNKKVFIPAQLKGVEAPYASAVDDENRIWIIVGGDNATVWHAAINRLLYN